MRYTILILLMFFVAKPVFGEARTSGSAVPSYELMKRPDQLRSSPLGPGSCQFAWRPTEYQGTNIDYKWEPVVYDGVEVLKCRQASSDGNFHTIGTSWPTGNESNKAIEVAFNVWYWGEQDAEAYFADGNGSPEASVDGRASLPPSTGASFPVRLRVTAGADGKFRIAFHARGRCALTLEEFYYFRDVH